MTAIFRRHSRGNWPTRFGAPAARSIFRCWPPYGSEGHWLAEADDGVKLAAAALDRALKGLRLPHRGEETMTLYGNYGPTMT